MNREISLAETLKMYAVYTAGATMEAVGEQFHRSSSGVQRAFARWSLPVRRWGGPRPAKPPPRKPAAPRLRTVTFKPPPKSYQWCRQCERRVSAAEAGQCGSRFCKAADKAHQALGLAIAGCEGDQPRREQHG